MDSRPLFARRFSPERRGGPKSAATYIGEAIQEQADVRRLLLESAYPWRGLSPMLAGKLDPDRSVSTRALLSSTAQLAAQPRQLTHPHKPTIVVLLLRSAHFAARRALRHIRRFWSLVALVRLLVTDESI